jgi:hypothetical protein
VPWSPEPIRVPKTELAAFIVVALFNDVGWIRVEREKSAIEEIAE